jgi:hypothetical protein
MLCRRSQRAPGGPALKYPTATIPPRTGAEERLWPVEVLQWTLLKRPMEKAAPDVLTSEEWKVWEQPKGE